MDSTPHYSILKKGLHTKFWSENFQGRKKNFEYLGVRVDGIKLKLDLIYLILLLLLVGWD
jgi:hypothetical protein